MAASKLGPLQRRPSLLLLFRAQLRQTLHALRGRSGAALLLVLTAGLLGRDGLTQLGRVAVGPPAWRLGLATIWALASLPVVAAALRGVPTLWRVLPASRGWLWAAHLLPLFAIHLPWVLLLAASGLQEALASWLLLIAAQGAGLRGPWPGAAVVGAAAAAAWAAPMPAWLRLIAALPLAAWGLGGWVSNGNSIFGSRERSAFVRGGAVRATCAAGVLLALRQKRPELSRAALASLALGCCAALALRNNAISEPSQALAVSLGFLTIGSAIAATHLADLFGDLYLRHRPLWSALGLSPRELFAARSATTAAVAGLAGALSALVPAAFGPPAVTGLATLTAASAVLASVAGMSAAALAPEDLELESAGSLWLWMLGGSGCAAAGFFVPSPWLLVAALLSAIGVTAARAAASARELEGTSA